MALRAPHSLTAPAAAASRSLVAAISLATGHTGHRSTARGPVKKMERGARSQSRGAGGANVARHQRRKISPGEIGA